MDVCPRPEPNAVYYTGTQYLYLAMSPAYWAYSLKSLTFGVGDLYCMIDPTLLLSIYFDFNAYDIFSCQNLFIFFKLN